MTMKRTKLVNNVNFKKYKRRDFRNFKNKDRLLSGSLKWKSWLYRPRRRPVFFIYFYFGLLAYYQFGFRALQFLTVGNFQFYKKPNTVLVWILFLSNLSGLTKWDSLRESSLNLTIKKDSEFPYRWRRSPVKTMKKVRFLKRLTKHFVGLPFRSPFRGFLRLWFLKRLKRSNLFFFKYFYVKKLFRQQFRKLYSKLKRRRARLRLWKRKQVSSAFKVKQKKINLYSSASRKIGYKFRKVRINFGISFGVPLFRAYRQLRGLRFGFKGKSIYRLLKGKKFLKFFDKSLFNRFKRKFGWFKRRVWKRKEFFKMQFAVSLKKHLPKSTFITDVVFWNNRSERRFVKLINQFKIRQKTKKFSLLFRLPGDSWFDSDVSSLYMQQRQIFRFERSYKIFRQDTRMRKYLLLRQYFQKYKKRLLTLKSRRFKKKTRKNRHYNLGFLFGKTKQDKKFIRFMLQHRLARGLHGFSLPTSRRSLFTFHYLSNNLISTVGWSSRFFERTLFAGLFFEPLNAFYFFYLYNNRFFWSSLISDLYVYNRTYNFN